MYSKMKTSESIRNYSDKIKMLREWIDKADAVVIGAGAGLSAAAGHMYSGKRFEDNFKDFIEKYNLPDMYSAGFYPFKTLEEQWAYWSRHIYLNRYMQDTNELFPYLLDVIKDKNYFVITTNADHLFQKNGFDKKRLFYTQGDYGLWQCSVPCHNKTYDNEEAVMKMVREQKDMKIPSELIPLCPVCHKPMDMNLRKDNTFVEDEGWHDAMDRYEDFLNEYADKSVLFLELGVGGNTPGIIKYPFWQMTYKNKNARYACINMSQAFAPDEINSQSICIDNDIMQVIIQIKGIG